MPVIQKAIYTITGIMPKRLRLSTCEEIGKSLVTKAQQSGKFTTENVSELLAQSLTKKNNSRVLVSADKKVFCDFTERECGISRELAESVFDTSLSAVVPGAKSGKALLSLRVADMPLPEAANTTAHELQHLMNQTNGLRSKLEAFYIKLRGKKWFDRYIEKYGTVVNERVNSIQQILLANFMGWQHALSGHTEFGKGLEALLLQTKTESLRDLQKCLQTMIKQTILLPNADKRNLTMLKGIRATLKDECRSYRVGSKVQEFAEGGATQNATRSELLAMLYDETGKVLKGEINKQRLNKLRRIFGIKPKDYSIKPQKIEVETPEIRRFKENFEKLVEEIKKNPEALKELQ